MRLSGNVQRLVRRLILFSESDMGERAVRVLAEAPEYGRVTELVLVHLCLNPADFERLASSATLTRLRLLVVPGTSNNDRDEVGDAGCAAIAASPNFAHLEVLELEGTEIGDAGVVALAGSPHLANLRRLDLRFNEVGDAGALALASSPHLRSLQELLFEGNEAGPEAIRALVDRFSDPLGKE